jgi:hypothetical protein
MNSDRSVESKCDTIQPTVMTLSFVFAVVLNESKCCKYIATGPFSSVVYFRDRQQKTDGVPLYCHVRIPNLYVFTSVYPR